ncbi:hypothetical protein PIB30_036335 [Stylosanthes scabra]|uniref:Ubiquitin-like protease family profile domain-containing protein n=1 Tax=Stylosanthes scabra TaxID=79078 RepID=A0ABU6VFI6_9FABA|nr:hypothetical protein [Stylosanthes scabra]
MFDTFDTVSLGRDDSDQVAVEAPIVAPTQPSQPEKEDEHHENINEAGVEDKEAGVAVTLAVDEVILEASQPQGPTEDAAEHTEIDPEPISIQIPIEPEAGAEDEEAGVAVPLVVDEVMLEEAQPEPLVVIMEQGHRFQREVYCVPPEIFIRMFETHGTNFMDKKTKKPVHFTDLKDKQFFELLDKEKLRMSRACNVLDQFRVWAGAKTLIKKGSNTLHLRPVDVPKQLNPTDCGVYVMKWMEALDTNAISYAHTFKKTIAEEWDQVRTTTTMEKIVAKVLLSEHNTLNFEAMNQSRTMTQEAITEGRTKLGRRPKPSTALKSPFRNPSTAELEKKH